MPSPSEFSTNPDANVTIGGINVAEGCPAANLNNALRYVCATIRVQYDATPNTSALVPKSGAIFSDQPTFLSRGGFLYNNDPANASGRVFIQPAGGAAPAMSNGDWLLEY